MREDLLSADRVTQHGSFHLDLAPGEAFKLFTAAGERLWVPGWSPTIFGALPQHRGLVFTTGIDEEHTIWTVIESDAVRRRACYSRVTPASRAGIVTVEILEDGDGSLVEVSYDLTALTPAGAASLQAFSPAAFASMMREWQRLIVAMSAQARADLAALTV